MNKQPPSIFNDVIGPIMRGPSSSHTAASVRIGTLARQFLAGNPVSFRVEFEPKGSLAATYHGHGSDIGLAAGLMNMKPTDPDLVNALDIAKDMGIEICFDIVEYEAVHPNTYRITAGSDAAEEVRLIFVSTGGGMVELQEIDGTTVAISGDYYETLLFFNSSDKHTMGNSTVLVEQLVSVIEHCDIIVPRESTIINIRTANCLPETVLIALGNLAGLIKLVQLKPILPITSRQDCIVPYTTAAQILAVAETSSMQLWELAANYESLRGNISRERVASHCQEVLTVMKDSIAEGLSGTEYSNRILGPQSHKIHEERDKLIHGGSINRTIAYITAVMEAKSAMGAIVAAPTAGSCGVLPGTLFAVAEEMGLDEEAILRGLLAAGIIGVLIATRSTFAAESCGCQAECGSASGMAAAALVEMMGGNTGQALDAASMALQNVLGMVCDPVGDRVEVPCLGKNVMAGMNAIASANMALAGYDRVIPLDETIEAMDQVGRMLPSELRCTGRGGLSITKTSQAIYARLNKKSEML